jgi:hypothetical protein
MTAPPQTGFGPNHIYAIRLLLSGDFLQLLRIPLLPFSSPALFEHFLVRFR